MAKNKPGSSKKHPVAATPPPKKPVANNHPDLKHPVVGGNPERFLELPVAWNFHSMDPNGEWACDLSSLSSHTERLANYFEGRTPENIFHNGDRHSHPMTSQKVCRKAKERLNQLQIDPETVYQISLNKKARLWGIMYHNIFKILWLDLNHTVCKK
jgi:hypothetical protein